MKIKSIPKHNLIEKFKSRHKFILGPMGGLLLSIGLLISLFLFYQECNTVKIKRARAMFEMNYRYRAECSFSVVINNSQKVKDKSQYPGCHASIFLEPEHGRTFFSVEKEEYKLDSVWAIANISIQHSLFNNLYFKPIKSEMDKYVKKERTLASFVDSTKLENDPFNKEDLYTIYSSCYFMRDGNTGMTLNSDFDFSSLPAFLSPNNISLSCVALNLEIYTPKYPKKVSVVVDFVEPVNILNIFPEPDVKSETALIFSTREKIQYIIDHGAFVYAESILYKGMQEVRNYILITLMGMLMTICGSLLIKLIFAKFSEDNKKV